jgi:hypothetical protein
MTNDFWDGSTTSTNLDVSAFFDSSVTEHLCRVLEMGVLVSFGLTRDGGAIGIAVLDDGRRRREYFRTPQDAADWLGLAAAALSGNGVGDNGAQPSSRQDPTRGRQKGR